MRRALIFPTGTICRRILVASLIFDITHNQGVLREEDDSLLREIRVMTEAPKNQEVPSDLAHVFFPTLESADQPGEQGISALSPNPLLVHDSFSRPVLTETTSPVPEERYFLEGPKSRRSEFFMTLHIARDFLRGFRVLHFIGPCVTVFGSARFTSDYPFYELARSVGRGLSQLGFTVMTGGGPGIMEAANRGAREIGGKSVGCNIRLPEEQQPNLYLDRHVTLRHFFVRKVLLIKYSYAFVVMPCGFRHHG